MEKGMVLLALLLVLSTFTTSPLVRCAKYYSKSLPYKPVQEQVTKLRFFLHDTLSGKNPSSVLIARPNSTKNVNDPAAFGSTYAIDDPITVGPELTSEVIGNARGIYVATSQDKNVALVMYVDVGFTSGKFNGSSISVFSRNPITQARGRELAVVGGRGSFRFAKGFVLVNTYFLNSTNGDAVLEWNVEIVHP